MKLAVLPALALGILAAGCGSNAQAEARDGMIADCTAENNSEAACTCATDETFAALDEREREVITRGYLASQNADPDLTPEGLAEEMGMDLEEIQEVAASATVKMSGAMANITAKCQGK